LTVAELQAAGVKRISLGMSLYGHAIAALEQAAKSLAAGDIASASKGLGFPRLTELLGQGRPS
jgi:2-methylisocitrate lyase-like PEP mutase family enzyme